MRTTYRGFIITPVFQYTSSQNIFDFEYYRISDEEDSGLMIFTTFERVKKAIDARLEERPEIFEVRLSRDTTSVIPGLIEALNFSSFGKEY